MAGALDPNRGPFLVWGVPPTFDAATGIRILGELVGRPAPPAGEEEICDQVLALAGSAWGARNALFLPAPASKALALRCLRADPAAALTRGAEDCVRAGQSVTTAEPGATTPSAVALPVPGSSGPIGALALDHPAVWDDPARSFLESMARVLGASLQASRTIEAGRLQGELLARRNVELEALRELGGVVQEATTEEGLLQRSLELLLLKLGLQSGWIFWGPSREGKLHLGAAHGVDEEFVRRSREHGPGECLCRDVFETGRLRFARNTVDCPRVMELFHTETPMTHACIPLRFERGVLGVLNIANRPGQMFSAQELQFLETAGTQVCLAVDKLRNSRAERRRNAEAVALATLARAIGGSLDQREVLAAVGEYARQLLALDRVRIFLGDEPGPWLFSYLSGPPLDGMEPGSQVDFPSLQATAAMTAITERRTLVVHDAATDPLVNSGIARRWGIGALIIVPLTARERLEGVLIAEHAVSWSWTSEEVDLLNALSRYAALALENARLFRQTQEALRQAAEAQYGMMRAERLAAVGTLASSLAHEVRNPLNSINLQLVLLARKAARSKDGSLAEIAGTAQHEISRLDGLVEEFLSLSSIDRLTLACHDPAAVVQDVLALMGPAAAEKNVRLVSESAPGPPLAIDREKFKQVFINLVRNGIEAMPDGGTLTVSLRRSGAVVDIDIADTGVGIPENLDVFDFFLTTKRGGTGLGLPIARRLIEAHGGTLSYVSEPGRGTVFTIHLKSGETP